MVDDDTGSVEDLLSGKGLRDRVMANLAAFRDKRLAAGGYDKPTLARDFLAMMGAKLDPEKDRLMIAGITRLISRLEFLEKHDRRVVYDLFGERAEVDYEMAVPSGEEDGAPEHKCYEDMSWGEYCAHVDMVLEQLERDQARAADKVRVRAAGESVDARPEEPLVDVLARLKRH